MRTQHRSLTCIGCLLTIISLALKAQWWLPTWVCSLTLRMRTTLILYSSGKNVEDDVLFYKENFMNESDPRSDVHYLGSRENKA